MTGALLQIPIKAAVCRNVVLRQRSILFKIKQVNTTNRNYAVPGFVTAIILYPARE